MTPSNELLAQDIQNIKEDIREINLKLDSKYVSHETFKLTVDALNTSITFLVKVGLFLITPVYIAVVALVFKAFTQ